MHVVNFTNEVLHHGQKLYTVFTEGFNSVKVINMNYFYKGTWITLMIEVYVHLFVKWIFCLLENQGHTIWQGFNAFMWLDEGQT